MLSRLAESFFWIGRYVERAEATARLLSEHHHLLVEDRTVPEAAATAVLLDALSMPHQGVESAAALVDVLVGTPTQPSTVVGSVTAARENARAVRDAISGDVFEALNATHLALSRGVTLAASPSVAMSRVLERLLVVNGVIEWMMSRDEAHLFLSLGRSLERIDLTARLLDVRHEQLWPDSGPVATLRSAGALSAFLRTQQPMGGDEARAFLVLDDAFPRSLRHCAAEAEQAVRGLERIGATDGGALLREVGMLRSLLEFAGLEPDPAEVDRLAHAAQLGAVAAAEAVAAGFFRQVGTIVWSH